MTLTQINKAGLDELALDHVFTIGASGSSAYTFQGEGLNGTVNNPTLYLTRGKTYRFENGSGGHPIRIQSTSGASGTAYNTGVTNNAQAGTVIVEVQHDAPDILYYQCTSHAAMNGILYITGALADGGVTTDKLAAGAVTNPKLATNAVGAGNLQQNAVETAKIQDDAVTNAKIADDAIDSPQIANGAVDTIHLADLNVDTAKITPNAVTTAKIADQAVTLAKLEHGTSSNNGKFLRANNGADPTFETVNTDLVSDTSPQLGGTLDLNGNQINGGDSNGSSTNMIMLGGSNDLQIYHDGSHSYIKDTGTGNLRILTSSTFTVNNAANSANMILATDGGSVDLFHNGTKKFETGSNYSVVTGIANGNPAGLKVTNSDANSNYSHAELRLISKNGASYGVIYNDHANSNVRIGHNTTGNTLEVFNDGVIRSQGIKFGSDTAAANNLADYEEGDWTPQVWRNGGSSEISLGSGSRYGRYIKIGDLLWVSFYWYNPSCSTSTGQYYVIRNLPFSLMTGNTGGYQFIPGGYLYFNGSSSGDYSGGGAYRWQANGTFSSSTLTLYANPNNTNVSGALEFSGTGALRVA